MNIAIVDDERFYQSKITELLQHNFPSYYVKSFNNTDELRRCKVKFDILLLDIELSEENGVTFAKNNIHEYQHIIYVTSHNEQVYDAFDINIVGFISKNKIDELLVPKIIDVEKRIRESLSIKFNCEEGFVYVKKSEIIYINIIDEIITMYTLHKEFRLTYTSLQKIFPIVFGGFYYASRNCLISIQHIHSFNKATHCITMSNGQIISVSHRRWKELLKHFNEEVDV